MFEVDKMFIPHNCPGYVEARAGLVAILIDEQRSGSLGLLYIIHIYIHIQQRFSGDGTDHLFQPYPEPSTVYGSRSYFKTDTDDFELSESCAVSVINNSNIA